MATQKTIKQIGAEVGVVVPQLGATLYVLGKLPRNGLKTETKHGSGGTAGTYAKVCEALKAGPMTIAALQAVCKDNGDPGFARYAVRNHWLLPSA